MNSNNYIVAQDRSTINNNSTVHGSFNAYSPDISEALSKLDATVTTSGSAAGSEYLEAFREELKSDRPKHAVLKALFEGIKQAVPNVASMTDVVVKLSSLFHDS